MSDPLYTLYEKPEGLRDPVLVVHMEGWIDAGSGGIGAMNTLLTSLETTPVASFRLDGVLDQRARRPLARVIDGVTTSLNWPRIQLASAHDRAGRDVLLLSGPEPDYRWRAFARDVCNLGSELGARMMIGLGSFPSPVPHTRPTRLVATATTEELVQSVGFIPGEQQVPVGLEGVLERAFADAGIPAMGLWAPVPYYAAPMPYPAASLALLETLSSLAGLDLDLADLKAAADGVRERMDGFVRENPQFAQLVERLEAQGGEELGVTGFGELPTGDELAAEFERFLREQEEE
jgi:proteasome assembly chaperone (PAC2) family protein